MCIFDYYYLTTTSTNGKNVSKMVYFSGIVSSLKSERSDLRRYRRDGDPSRPAPAYAVAAARRRRSRCVPTLAAYTQSLCPQYCHGGGHAPASPPLWQHSPTRPAPAHSARGPKRSAPGRLLQAACMTYSLQVAVTASRRCLRIAPSRAWKPPDTGLDVAVVVADGRVARGGLLHVSHEVDERVAERHLPRALGLAALSL